MLRIKGMGMMKYKLFWDGLFRERNLLFEFNEIFIMYTCISSAYHRSDQMPKEHKSLLEGRLVGTHSFMVSDDNWLLLWFLDRR